MDLVPGWEALLGGALIGAAALLLYATLGRIAGLSGIGYGALWGPDRAWRLVFLAGLVGGAALAAFGLGFGPPRALNDPLWLLLLAGALVGFGTRLGNGCTSGHGVCGTARLSPRSIAATAAFMAVGMASATLLRPLLA